MVLFWIALAWITGIIITDLILIPRVFLWSIVVCGLGMTMLFWDKRIGRVVGLVMLFGALGGLRYEPPTQVRESKILWRLIDEQHVVIQGSIFTDPKWKEDGQQIILQSQKIQIGKTIREVDDLVLLSLAPYPAYTFGQCLLVSGELREPPPAKRPGEFDYREYLARKQIFVLMRDPFLRILPDEFCRSSSMSFSGLLGNYATVCLQKLLVFRKYCYTIILRALPEPQASVAAGMVIGLGGTMPDETNTIFTINGINHILVISGSHFSIVASVISSLALRLRLSRTTTFWFSLCTVWLYVLFVGATGTVLLAGLMASLVVLATATERQTESWLLLIAACWILSFWKPHMLWDLSFQLSALATTSLIAFSASVKQFLTNLPPFRWFTLSWIMETLSATLAAQILVLPLILYHFGNLSLIAPLSNVLLAPVVPYIMFFSVLALGFNLISNIISIVPWCGQLTDLLAQGLWMIAWLPITYMTEGARILATIPWAAVNVSVFPLWILLSYYGTISCWWVGIHWKKNRIGKDYA